MPARFVHLHNLSDGDAFYLVPGKHGVTFTMAKEEDVVINNVVKEAVAAE